MAYDEELAARIRAELAGVDGVRERRMFGGLGFMVDGHMAVAAGSQGALMLRAGHEAQGVLLGRPGVTPMEMRGRAMNGWLLVDREALTEDAALREVVRLGVDHVRSLPPKA